jgi:excisionase family DNA binding protein
MSPKNPLPEKFHTVPQIAELLGVSERSVWRWLDQRELTAHRFGRLVRISEENLRAFLDKKRLD